MIRHGQSALDKRFASGVRVSKWVGLGAILLSFLFVLAGCGSDSGSPQTRTKNNLADKKDQKVKVKPGPGQSQESLQESHEKAAGFRGSAGWDD